MRIYYNQQAVPVAPYRIPLGLAKLKREGADISLISYGWTVVECMLAADKLAKNGIQADVLDLRSLVPLDWDSIKASVSKTKRAVVVHAATEFCGFGAEIAAKLQEDLFGELRAPVLRLGAVFTPPPFSLALESQHFPTVEKIVDLSLNAMGTKT
jgi:pyruvate/2-oxoglutarate/acetoin dehydrogenase E1 component